MNQIPFLQKGDTIGVISTARKISKEEIEPSIKMFQSWGLKVEIGKHLFDVSHQFAGTTEERLTDLQYMLDASHIKAVICARGGYGTVKIIDEIDFTSFIKKPKWIVGYSDVTVLHSHIQNNFSIPTLHATMPINFPKDLKENKTIKSLKTALFGAPINYVLDAHPFDREGKAEAELVGGNLSILYSLTGSNSDIDTSGKILFIEDLDEYLYHIDRMMMNLKKAGKLTNLKGLVVGGMSDMNDNQIPYGKTAEEIIQETVAEYNYPLMFGFPAGHRAENYALYLGKKVFLEVGETEKKLTFK